MVSGMYRLTVIVLVAFAFVDNNAGCRAMQPRITLKNGKAVVTWDCPPDHVLIQQGRLYLCVKKCAACPNGFCNENKCHCFPGTSRDSAGVCGKICRGCDNGWCSSESTCECNEGFTLSWDRCVSDSQPDPSWELPFQFTDSVTTRPVVPHCPTDYVWDPDRRDCIPYESAEPPRMNVRMDE